MIDTGDTKSSGESRDFWRIINLLSLGLIFIVAYYLIHMQTLGLIVADTKPHINFIQKYIDGTLYIPHPLWHLGTHYLSQILGVNYDTGASIFSAFLVTLYAILIYKIAQSLDEYGENNTKWFLITFISLAIGPLFIMSFNPHIYLGVGSPSVWHNVTLLTVKPFALLSVFLTIKFFATNKLNYFILALLVTVISIFAKPNYIIIFLPSLVVYMILKRYFDKKQLQFAFIAILFSVAALAYQFTNEFGDDGKSSVVFDFLGVWSMYSSNIPVSIMLALGLPFLITLFNYQSVKKNEYIKFTWLLVLFSLILFSCFAEEGLNYSHANFSWSWNISLSLIYIFTIIEYFKQYFSMPAVFRYSLLAMMLYQVYVGWYFLIGMFNGVPFNAVVSTFPFF